MTSNSQGDQHLYYAYDATGNRSRLTFQGGGVTYFTYYAYDARNQLSSLTSPLGESVYYQYDALGREIARRLPNTVTTYHNYDAASQVTSLIHRGSSSVLQSLYYTYDADGQRTKIEREDNTRLYYSYDNAHRLTGEDWLDPGNVHLYAFAYNYDAAGNRTRKTCNSATTYYQYNNLNELTTERILGGGTTDYTWTADGEMATKHDIAGWTYYTWDVDESLKTIQTPTVTLESKYNSRMQRVWRSENGTAERLVYDSQKLIAEATSTALNRYYLSEGGSVYSPLLAQLGSEHWFLFDALGTTLGLTSPTGSLTDTFKYEAFGTSLGRTGTTVTPYQYVGGYGYFNEPNVSNAGYRWYTPNTGKWLSRDPLRIGNPYVYVGGLPTIFVDPMGLAPHLSDWLIGAGDWLTGGRYSGFVDWMADAAADYYWIEPRERHENDPCFSFGSCMRDCLGHWSATAKTYYGAAIAAAGMGAILTELPKSLAPRFWLLPASGDTSTIARQAALRMRFAKGRWAIPKRLLGEFLHGWAADAKAISRMYIGPYRPDAGISTYIWYNPSAETIWSSAGSMIMAGYLGWELGTLVQCTLRCSHA